MPQHTGLVTDLRFLRPRCVRRRESPYLWDATPEFSVSMDSLDSRFRGNDERFFASRATIWHPRQFPQGMHVLRHAMQFTSPGARGGGQLTWVEAWVVGVSCRCAARCRVVASAWVATRDRVGGRAFFAGAGVPVEALSASPQRVQRGPPQAQAVHPQSCSRRTGPSGIS